MTAAWVYILIIIVAVILIAALMVYADYQAKIAAHERWAKREQARMDSRRWFEARMAQERAQEQPTASPVAQTAPPPHNPGHRRMLPLN